MQISHFGVIAILCSTLLTTGCQPKTDAVTSQDSTTQTGLTQEFSQQLTAQEAAISQQMISLIKQQMQQRAEAGQPLRRFNQVKTQACLQAQLEIQPNIPAPLAVGLFGQVTSYPAVIRFANASQMDDREADFRGASLKISVGQQQQDLLFNNHPVLFAANPQQFLAFIQAQADDDEAGRCI